MKKILIVFGTRPEGIKMAPLVHLMKEEGTFDVKVCISGQHKEMLDQVLTLFNIEPDYDLEIMTKGQDLYDVTSRCLLRVKEVLLDFSPDMVLVHGDTTTTFSTALASYYQQIAVGHVEAGLRTYDIYSPWPEEINRQLTDRISALFFSPTEESKKKLLEEGIHKSKIAVTGNTVIDALHFNINRIKNERQLETQIRKELDSLSGYELKKIIDQKFILVTAHRRENFGKGIRNICEALLRIAKNQKIHIIYPVHLNPRIKEPVTELLANHEFIHLLPPLEYLPFIYLMQKSYIILSDSGGIQEEAPSLGKPVLVLRDKTERPEGINAGTLSLVGTNSDNIYNRTNDLLNDTNLYKTMANAKNPYGDGNACQLILNKIKEYFGI